MYEENLYLSSAKTFPRYNCSGTKLRRSATPGVAEIPSNMKSSAKMAISLRGVIQK